MLNNIKEIVNYLLETTTDPIPQYILKKEILNEKLTTADIEAIHKSKWYKQLANEQWVNGSWGRFHSMDSRIKDKKFLTTEAALRRARDLGITRDDPIIKNCILLMERYLKGEEAWLDYIEKHQDNGKSFSVAFPFIIAANLSLFDPDNTLLTSKRKICINILKKSFAFNCFAEEIWEQDNRDYTGTCLRAWMVYPLWLLQNTNCIDDNLQRQYLDYIWNRNDGIYYISNFAPVKKLYLEDRGFTMWLSALESLSGFSLFSKFMEADVYGHLLSEVNRIIDDDIKLPPAHPITGHYTESWRNKNARKNDLILRIMRTLVKC